MLALTRRPAFILAASVFGLAFAVFVALFPFTPAGVPLEEGDVASRTVRAPRDISFVSPALTERRQDEAAAAVPNSLTFAPPPRPPPARQKQRAAPPPPPLPAPPAPRGGGGGAGGARLDLRRPRLQ